MSGTQAISLNSSICRRIEGKTQYPETEKRLRTFFDAGQTPETAIDETAIEIPF
jgi:hypothetical protein